jgi:hypothetical protein
MALLLPLDLSGRKTKHQKVDTKILEVIYLEIAGGGYLLITAYWKGKTR